MGALDAVADRIVHGARESYVRSLTARLVSALRALVSGGGSEAQAARALDMASARVAELAMGTWAEHRGKVTAEVAREVGRALRQGDERLSRELAGATGADGPWGLTNRARNDLAEATRGVREVVGRQNVAGMGEAEGAARRAAAAEAMQGAADAHHAARGWYEVAGAAVTRVDMGDDPGAVLADAVAELARRGLETVDYKSGRSTTVDAAVRRHIDSQLNQAANDMAVRRCEEWGVGLVMVDAHWGARPSHAAWQGRAYSLHGELEVDGVTYPDLCEATGYQGRNGWPLGARLAGVNCRHRIYPYVPGVSEIPSDDFEAMERKYGMTSEEWYRETQRQRALERELRAAKREAAFLEDEGLDATAQRYRIGGLQARLREHCRRTGLERDPTRERAYGVTHQPRGLNPQSKTAQAKRETALTESRRPSHEMGITHKQMESAHAKVDLTYIRSDEFASKFKGLTSNPDADRRLLMCARAMLEHRSGTEREDLYLVSVLDGKIKGKNVGSKERLSVPENSSVKNAVATEPRGTLVGIHNHPSNIPPTGSDFVTAGSRGYNMGVVVLHDGTVYAYRVGNRVFSSYAMDATIESYRRKGLSEVEAGERTMEDFAGRYGIEWLRL